MHDHRIYLSIHLLRKHEYDAGPDAECGPGFIWSGERYPGTNQQLYRLLTEFCNAGYGRIQKQRSSVGLPVLGQFHIASKARAAWKAMPKKRLKK